MTHCASGVEKGIQKGGKPIEVMGLLLGRPWISSTSSSSSSSTSPESSSSNSTTSSLETHTLLVSDVFPLPIEGFETRVVADDDNVTNYMFALVDSLERQGRSNSSSSDDNNDCPGRGGDEKFMGWYHSHPFDYMGEAHQGHCYLSNTDVTTQLQWQRTEDPHGNPFVAIVIDPLRSSVRGIPELKAFRAFPPEFSPTVRLGDGSETMTCPDGSIVPDEKSRLERWGNCWSRYYELDLEYFMSVHARRVLDTWKNQHLWMKQLVPSMNPTVEKQIKERQGQHLSHIGETFSHAHLSSSSHTLMSSGGNNVNKKTLVQQGGSKTPHQACSCASIMSSLQALRMNQGQKKNSSDHAEWDAAYQGLVDHIHETVEEQLCQAVKENLFSVE